VFVEPHTPRAHLVVIGDAPVAQTLAELASPLGFDVERIEAGDDGSVQLAGPTEIGPDSFIVAATLGQYDEAALEAALATDARYVALVGSRKRAAAVLATLRERGVPDGKLARVRAPAGLDLGRIEHREIAVAILAEIVKLRAALRRHGLDVGGDPDLFGRQHPASGPTVDRSETGGSGDVRSLPTDDISGAGDGPGAQAGPGADGHSAADGRTGAASGDAIDPVCGMTVDTATARFTAERDDRVFYFCCDGCRRRFESEPERYLAAGR
jgi:xanthine dehydrogenase accessory factor